MILRSRWTNTSGSNLFFHHRDKLCQKFGADYSAACAPPATVRAPEVHPVSKTGGDSKTFNFVISSAAVDRAGDTVAVNGWRLDAYRKNPVVLFAHNSGSLPVGKATRVYIEGGKLKATARFADTTMGREVQDLIETGYLKATSVGFVPHKYDFSSAPGRKYGIDFIEQELLEFSVVPIPANPEALIEGTYGKSMTEGERARARRQRDYDRLRLGNAP